jgi:ribonucleoside-diphosphate reductase alpha chain
MARERLPDERTGRTHHFTILSAKTLFDGAEGTTELEEIDGYITTGCYPSIGNNPPRLGEIFIRISKQGDERAGWMDGFATMLSIALQNGADLSQLCSKMIGTRFPPFGATNNPNIPRCTSLLDYIGRYLQAAYLPKMQEEADVIPLGEAKP